MSTFGQRLKDLRNSRGISQNELSKHIRVSKSSVNMYERDEREPGFETLEAIADYFNVNMDYLLGREPRISADTASVKEYVDSSDNTSNSVSGTSMVPPLVAIRLSEIADEYKRTQDQDKLVSEIVNLGEQDRTALLSFALKIIYAVQQGNAVVVDDDGKPITPRTDGPQDTSAPSEGKATPSETAPEGEEQ